MDRNGNKPSGTYPVTLAYSCTYSVARVGVYLTREALHKYARTYTTSQGQEKKYFVITDNMRKTRPDLVVHSRFTCKTAMKQAQYLRYKEDREKQLLECGNTRRYTNSTFGFLVLVPVIASAAGTSPNLFFFSGWPLFLEKKKKDDKQHINCPRRNGVTDGSRAGAPFYPAPPYSYAIHNSKEVLEVSKHLVS